MDDRPARPDPTEGGAGPGLLIERYLPRYDVAVVHADVVRAPPAQCYARVLALDLLRAPLIRVAMGVRRLPRRLSGVLHAPGRTPGPDADAPTFRLADMVDLGWIVLAETPGVELVLGQVSRPWKADASPSAVPITTPTTAEEFTDFAAPGFAKIVTGLRVDRYGTDSSILTLETRVATTDALSRRRFRRYWLLIGPFSSAVPRTALRLLASELRRDHQRSWEDPGSAG